MEAQKTFGISLVIPMFAYDALNWSYVPTCGREAGMQPRERKNGRGREGRKKEDGRGREGRKKQGREGAMGTLERRRRI